MQDISCKFCGGGKFVRFPTWMECYYCGSEYELKKEPPVLSNGDEYLLRYAKNAARPMFDGTYYPIQSTYFCPERVGPYRRDL